LKSYIYIYIYIPSILAVIIIFDKNFNGDASWFTNAFVEPPIQQIKMPSQWMFPSNILETQNTWIQLGQMH